MSRKVLSEGALGRGAVKGQESRASRAHQSQKRRLAGAAGANKQERGQCCRGCLPVNELVQQYRQQDGKDDRHGDGGQLGRKRSREPAVLIVPCHDAKRAERLRLERLQQWGRGRRGKELYTGGYSGCGGRIW